MAVKEHPLKADYLEFVEAWREEQRNYGGLVPARMLPLTGIILYELERAGFVDRVDDCYAPRGWQ